jgi:hypothetical protein
MRSFVVLAVFLFGSVAFSQPVPWPWCRGTSDCDRGYSCVYGTCLSDNAPHCIAQGQVGNDYGVGGVAGCMSDADCCDGLHCVRAMSGYYVCE